MVRRCFVCFLFVLLAFGDILAAVVNQTLVFSEADFKYEVLNAERN